MHPRQFLSPYLLAILGITLFGVWLMQSFFYLNSDVSWLLTCTRRLMNGGMYSTDFFETNPPLILFLYTPIIALSNLLPVNMTAIAKLYILAMGLGVFALCYPLLKKIFTDKVLLRYGFSLLLLNCFLVLPVREYGQRENILLIFCFPYLLSIPYLLRGYVLSNSQAVTLGLLAGIGFALKPFYLVAFIGVELYYLSQRRRLASCLRRETLTMGVFFLMYMAVVYLYFKDYLFVMIPFIAKYYYQGYSGTWMEIITSRFSMYVGLLSLLVLFKRRTHPYPHLLSVLLIAALTLYLCYVFQLNERYYKLVPILACEALMLGLLFWQFLEEARAGKFNYLAASVIGVLSIAFLRYSTPDLANSVTYLMPYILFTLATLLFCFFYHIYYPVQDALNTALLRTALIIGAVAAFSVMTLNSFLTDSRFGLMATLTAVLAGFFIPRQTPRRNAYFAAFIVSVLVVAYPVHWLADMFASMDLPDEQRDIVAFLQKNLPGESVYVVSGGNYTYPLIDYDHVESASRFPYFWMMSGLIRAEKKSPHDVSFLQDKQFFLDMIYHDLEWNKPGLIFIALTDHYDSNQMYNYLNYFFQDARIKMLFNDNYRFYTIQKSDDYYSFAVYRRIQPAKTS